MLIIRKIYADLKNGLNRLGGSRTCYVCQNSFFFFLPYKEGMKSISPFIRSLDVIGSDVENFSCPCCGSHDRERHLLMYMDQLNLWYALRGKVLHFAPETHIVQRIAQLSPEEYVKGDLFPTSPDIEKVDITSIDYPNQYFDFIICNHVLEHIPDIDTALRELFRVLKSGGKAVLQTPYSSILSRSFSDENIDTDEKRDFFYGQDDHVRVFGNDLFQMLAQAGFQVTLYKHAKLLSKFDSKQFGVNPREDLIFVTKP